MKRGCASVWFCVVIYYVDLHVLLSSSLIIAPYLVLPPCLIKHVCRHFTHLSSLFILLAYWRGPYCQFFIFDLILKLYMFVHISRHECEVFLYKVIWDCNLVIFVIYSGFLSHFIQSQ